MKNVLDSATCAQTFAALVRTSQNHAVPFSGLAALGEELGLPYGRLQLLWALHALRRAGLILDSDDFERILLNASPEYRVISSLIEADEDIFCQVPFEDESFRGVSGSRPILDRLERAGVTSVKQMVDGSKGERFILVAKISA
jgi:hypothetical protein